MTIQKTSILFLFFLVFACSSAIKESAQESFVKRTEVNNQSTKEIVKKDNQKTQNKLVLGAERLELYLPLLKNKKVGMVTNHTGVIFLEEEVENEEGGRDYRLNPVHLVDFLVNQNINIQTIFAPEHGFRGKADAGELVKNGKDVKTGLPIISLYGKNKKPKPSQIQDLDVILFDIQDVGVRFYTYISTMAYVMEAAAEQNIPVVVLDRPNPNAHYIDGPVLEPKYKSFVGLHAVPVVYGMTIGEYAKMVNGEKWLKNRIFCDLTVVSLLNYTHETEYDLPIKPSPNLPNGKSINLYPSLCFFEGTNVSVGRGTNMQFQIFGAPNFKPSNFSFVPKPNQGAKNPKHNGKTCHGKDLRNHTKLNQLNLSWLLEAYKQNSNKNFFNQNLFFDKLAGTDKLRKQIMAGKTEKEIRATWQSDLQKFKTIRAKYLLYD